MTWYEWAAAAAVGYLAVALPVGSLLGRALKRAGRRAA